MSKPSQRKDGYLADSIRRYGFAATIEVTNALVDSKEKVGQSLSAKSYLEQIAGDGPKISAGLAYNGNLVDPCEMSSMDFIIDIACYDPDRLEDVANEMLSSSYLIKGDLTHRHTSMIEKILESYDEDMPLPTFFAYSSMDECARKIGEDPKQYWCNLSNIKGLCMELYIKSLFGDEIEDRLILNRHKFSLCDEKMGIEREHEADEIVVCKEDDFYAALKRISNDEKFDTWVKRWDYV